jgi:hypothetical protein
VGRQSRKIKIELENATADSVKKLVTDITADLIEQTPVETGWARANWIPGLDQPEGTEPVGDETSVDEGAQQQGIAEIITGYTIDKDAFIFNNVPYIERLNDGQSPQAPAGFVDSIIEKRVSEANERKI